MFTKLFILLAFIVAATNAAVAQTITIRCPHPNQLTFSKQHSNQRWNEYYASGDTRITGSKTFHLEPLSAFTECHKANQLYGASYLENAFVCDYDGLKDNGQHGYPTLSTGIYINNCHFQTGDSEECMGDENHCVLVCEL